MLLCYDLSMAQTVCSFLSAEDRQRLAAILADRNRPQKRVARVRIILHSAERLEVASEQPSTAALYRAPAIHPNSDASPSAACLFGWHLPLHHPPFLTALRES